jgi:L-ribulose-5-phosphate 4-epimerase
MDTLGLAKRVGISPEIELLHRRKLAVMARMCSMHNWIGLFGHLSIRIEDTPLVLMTPGCGAEKSAVRAEDMFVFDTKGEILFHPGGDFPAPFPAEWRIHTQIHRDRPEMLCVCHLHAPDSTLLGVVNQDIVPVFNQGFELGDRVPTWDNPALVVNDALAEDLSKHLGSCVACQMRGHGSVVVGETPEIAFMHCFGMEQNARYQIAARPFGGHVPFTPDQIKHTMSQRKDLRVAWDIWKYFERKALHAHPAV